MLPVLYHLPEQTLLSDDELIAHALACLEKRLKVHGIKLYSPIDVINYLRLQLGSELNEVFAVLFLDNRHRVLAFEKLFQGTINTAAVYPRVILQRVLAHNASAVILAHNHPSQDTSPSTFDQELTKQIRTLLELIDVTLLDHFIVSASDYFSFSQYGWL